MRKVPLRRLPVVADEPRSQSRLALATNQSPEPSTEGIPAFATKSSRPTSSAEVAVHLLDASRIRVYFFFSLFISLEPRVE